MRPQLSVILPAYNSASLMGRALFQLSEYLSSLENRFEIIIVDDGSQDGEHVLALATENNCRYFRNSKNLGKGATLRRGMREAQGEVLIYTDADIPYEFDSIGTFYSVLLKNKCQVAIGDRTLPESTYYSQIPRYRAGASKLFSFLVNTFVLRGFPDTQCGVKGFTAEAAKEIVSASRINRYAVDVEFLVIAANRKYTIKRIPVRLRTWEETKMNVFIDGLVMLRDLLIIRINQLAGRYQA